MKAVNDICSAMSVASADMLAGIHPTIAAAIRPHVEKFYYGGRTYICERTMRDVMQRDDKALRLQMQSENSRTNFGETA